MDEQSQKIEGTYELSFKHAVGLYAIFWLIIVTLTLLLAMVLFGDPLAVQCATVAGYTFAVFWFTFFPSRGASTGYKLGNQTVQQQIPRLLAIHAAFLILVLTVETIALTLRPHLPPFWLQPYSRRSNTLFTDVLILLFVITGTVQVYISRRILRRSLRQAETMKKTHST